MSIFDSPLSLPTPDHVSSHRHKYGSYPTIIVFDPVLNPRDSGGTPVSNAGRLDLLVLSIHAGRGSNWSPAADLARLEIGSPREDQESG
jgi:hypothetical protein